MSALPWAPVRALAASDRGLTESRGSKGVDADLPPSRLSPAVPRARARVLRTTTKRTRTRERKPFSPRCRLVDAAPAAQPERKGLAQRGWRCEGQRARAGGAAQTHYELYKPVNRGMRYRESHRKKCTARHSATAGGRPTDENTHVHDRDVVDDVSHRRLGPATESCKLHGHIG